MHPNGRPIRPLIPLLLSLALGPACGGDGPTADRESEVPLGAAPADAPASVATVPVDPAGVAQLAAPSSQPAPPPTLDEIAQPLEEAAPEADMAPAPPSLVAGEGASGAPYPAVAASPSRARPKRMGRSKASSAAGRPSPRSKGEAARALAIDQRTENLGRDRALQRDVRGGYNRESYDHLAENNFVAVADDPRSTFSIDVDTASYSNVRRFLREGTQPPPDAVRIEELVNYFTYDYPNPTDGSPFAVVSEVNACPWNNDHLLVHVGLQGKRVAQEAVPARNLIFLLDVSGSMNEPNKLPLLKQGLAMMLEGMRPQDRIGIVVYAGASGVVIEPTADIAAIREALERLQAGGSTNGGAGIELAYRMAEAAFVRGGINRVILATDGDFNVGTTSEGALVRLIEAKRKSGIFLSVLGFGAGNLNDSTMEKLADNGNGNYAYIDSLSEARKVLVEQAGATLVTIAKDVKLQVEFNPKEVSDYRLVGYENRVLAHQDFNDDTKDAGEIGAGHTVTALYEVVPAGAGHGANKTDALKYQRQAPQLTAAADQGELMTVKIRYKQPDSDNSKLISFPIASGSRDLNHASADFRFSAAVAEFGLLLRNSKYKGTANYGQVTQLAGNSIGPDLHGHRREFVELVRTAAAMGKTPSAIAR